MSPGYFLARVKKKLWATSGSGVDSRDDVVEGSRPVSRGGIVRSGSSLGSERRRGEGGLERDIMVLFFLGVLSSLGTGAGKRGGSSSASMEGRGGMTRSGSTPSKPISGGSDEPSSGDGSRRRCSFVGRLCSGVEGISASRERP